jgi:cytochrome c peroxidase
LVKFKQNKIIAISALTAALPVVLWLSTKPALDREAEILLRENEQALRELHGQANTLTLKDPNITQRDIELAAFGRKLFFDSGLSANQQISCATCHQPGRSFTDGIPRGRGISQVDRNTPTIINSFANYWFFWDGRADSLAAQAMGPLENPLEHGLSRTEIVAHILKNYRQDFEKLFGAIPPELEAISKLRATPPIGPIKLPKKILETALPSLSNPRLIEKIGSDSKAKNLHPTEVLATLADNPSNHLKTEHVEYQKLSASAKSLLNQFVANVGKSIEAYERGLVANQSPFDRFISAWTNSSAESFSDHFDARFGGAELAGFILFQSKANCQLCHTGPNFSDNQFHNISLPPLEEKIDFGRAVGLQKVLLNELNCKSIFASDEQRQASESCKDLEFLDPESPETIGSFKTPTLRNLIDTAPYMHDGRFADLRAVLQHYNLMNTLPEIGFKEEILKPLALNPTEIELLEKFLASLGSPVRDLTAEKSIP